MHECEACRIPPGYITDRSALPAGWVELDQAADVRIGPWVRQKSWFFQCSACKRIGYAFFDPKDMFYTDIGIVPEPEARVLLADATLADALAGIHSTIRFLPPVAAEALRQIAGARHEPIHGLLHGFASNLHRGYPALVYLQGLRNLLQQTPSAAISVPSARILDALDSVRQDSHLDRSDILHPYQRVLDLVEEIRGAVDANPAVRWDDDDAAALLQVRTSRATRVQNAKALLSRFQPSDHPVAQFDDALSLLELQRALAEVYQPIGADWIAPLARVVKETRGLPKADVRGLARTIAYHSKSLLKQYRRHSRLLPEARRLVIEALSPSLLILDQPADFVRIDGVPALGCPGCRRAAQVLRSGPEPTRSPPLQHLSEIGRGSFASHVVAEPHDHLQSCTQCGTLVWLFPDERRARHAAFLPPGFADLCFWGVTVEAVLAYMEGPEYAAHRLDGLFVQIQRFFERGYLEDAACGDVAHRLQALIRRLETNLDVAFDALSFLCLVVVQAADRRDSNWPATRYGLLQPDAAALSWALREKAGQSALDTDASLRLEAFLRERLSVLDKLLSAHPQVIVSQDDLR